MKKLNKADIVVIIIVLFFFTAYCIEYSSINKIKKEIKRIEQPVQQNVVVECNDEEIEILSQETLYQYLLDIKVEHPKIVLAQALLETGNLTDEKMLLKNNLFGMKVPSKRPTMNIGNEEYCVFNTWYDAVIDYAFFQSKYCSNLNEKQYYNYLEKHYASDKNYVKKIKQIVKKL